MGRFLVALGLVISRVCVCCASLSFCERRLFLTKWVEVEPSRKNGHRSHLITNDIVTQDKYQQECAIPLFIEVMGMNLTPSEIKSFINPGDLRLGSFIIEAEKERNSLLAIFGEKKTNELIAERRAFLKKQVPKLMNEPKRTLWQSAKATWYVPLETFAKKLLTSENLTGEGISNFD